MEQKDQYFVFSVMEMVFRTTVAKKNGWNFYCGTIPVNSKVEKFTNIIDKEAIGKYRELYPDVKIVYVGRPDKNSYTMPEEK